MRNLIGDSTNLDSPFYKLTQILIDRSLDLAKSTLKVLQSKQLDPESSFMAGEDLPDRNPANSLAGG